jgi:hypothetical protein
MFYLGLRGCKKLIRSSFAGDSPFPPLFLITTSADERLSLLSLSTFGPSFLQRRLLNSHLREIQSDDNLLLEEALGRPSGVAANLSHDEMVQVLSDRGL